MKPIPAMGGPLLLPILAVETMLDRDENTSGQKRASYHVCDAKVRANIVKLVGEKWSQEGCSSE